MSNAYIQNAHKKSKHWTWETAQKREQKNHKQYLFGEQPVFLNGPPPPEEKHQPPPKFATKQNYESS